MQPGFDLSLIQLLDEIDRYGSFSKAAQKIYRVPSAISYSIQKAEQQLGFKIFERNGPVARLTPAGRMLLEEGRTLVEQASALHGRVIARAQGFESEFSLVLDSLIPASILTGPLRQFQQVARLTRIRIAHEVMNGTWEALTENRAALVIGIGEPPSRFSLAFQPLGQVQFSFCVAPTHPLACKRDVLTEADLLQYQAIIVGDSARSDNTRTIGLAPNQPGIVVPDIQTKQQYILLGLGFGFLPWHLAGQEIAAGRLKVCEVDMARLPEPVFMAWNKNSAGDCLDWWKAALVQPVQDCLSSTRTTTAGPGEKIAE